MFQIQSAVFGRGTGARIDGTFLGGAHGLAPSEGNWAVGFNMNFDLLEYKENRVKQRIESHKLEREQARKDALIQGLRGEVARANIALDAARRIAANTPIELEAARTLETQAAARYKAQLGTVVEVADAQQLLKQSEVDDALARLGVWRALFGLAAAQGEMDELLTAASR
jgi:outer membrane protein TolC